MERSYNGHAVPLMYNPHRDILEWSPAQVRNWVLGLGAEFHEISAELYRQHLKGSELLLIGVERLSSLGISNISHQEIILFALDLMRNVSGIDGMSTLIISKSLSFHINDLMQHLWPGMIPESANSSPGSDSDESVNELSVEVLEAIHSVLTDVHNLISVIEQYKQPGIPLEQTLSCIGCWNDKRTRLISEAETILNLLYAKETETRESINSALKACSELSELLAVLYTTFHHPPLCQHRSNYIVVPLISIPGSKLGFNLKTYRDGKIRISEIVPNSPAAKSKLLHIGDEVIRVRDQMIVAWELSSIICLFSENQSSLSLTIKSRSSDTHIEIPPIPRYRQNTDLSYRNKEVTSNSLTCLPSIVIHSDINEFRTHRPLTRRLSLPPEERSRVNSDISPYRRPIKKRFSEKHILSVSDDSEIPVFRDSSTPSPIPQAYRTLIVGGVVTRIPIHSDRDKMNNTMPKKSKGRLWKSISFRKSDLSSIQKPNDTLSPLTESYHIRIINGVPHKFPARALVDSKKKEKRGKGKKAKNNSNRSDLHLSHSLDNFRTSPELGLRNGYSECHVGTKQTSLSSSEVMSPERASSPNLQGKFIHRVTSNGQVEVELISEINEALDTITLENVPEELKIPCNTIRNPDCIGWLTKLGGSGLTPRNWRKRWFVLKGEDLYYYKSSFDCYALGKIYVPKYAIDVDIEVKKKHSFCLYHPLTRTYTLYADTEADAQKWILALSKLSRPAFCTPARLSSQSIDSIKDWKSKDSQISID